MGKEKEVKQQRPLIDMKSHILNVAGSLMTKKGVKNTSLKDISKVAGISKGTLYYYYSAKDDIIYDIAEENLSKITDEMLMLANEIDEQTSLNEIMVKLFKKVVNDEKRGLLHLYLLNEAVTFNLDLALKFKKQYELWQETIVSVLDKVNKNKCENIIFGKLILAVLDGFIIQKMCGAEEIPYDEVVGLILKDIKKE